MDGCLRIAVAVWIERSVESAHYLDGVLLFGLFIIILVWLNLNNSSFTTENDNMNIYVHPMVPLRNIVKIYYYFNTLKFNKNTSTLL